MQKIKKIDSLALIVSIVLYVIGVVLMFWFHPFVVNAAGNVPGGVGNTVTVNSAYMSGKTEKHVINSTMIAKDDVELIAYIDDSKSGDEIIFKTLWIYAYNPSSGFLISINNSYLSDFVGYESVYRNGELDSSFSLSSPRSSFYYLSVDLEYPLQVLNCSVSGCKIFKDYDSMKAYTDNGSLEGLVNEDNVDSGDYDPEIGYLHDLERHNLMYGDQDENGFYENFDYRFTWSDYYPEYDDSYLVEVRASCEVEVRKWFGVGKSSTYHSNIRELATGVRYKDLEYIIGLFDARGVFADFINEYMPGNSSVTDVIASASYRFDTFYFRIYRWDEETQSYKYGLWVRLSYDGSALDASLNKSVDAGYLDDDGNWKQNSDSDYGKGKKSTDIVGAGDNLDDAKADADLKQEEKDNGGKQLDLSNTNLKELWEWFTTSIYDLFTGLGVIPDFFARLFSFLPSPVIGFLAVGIVVAIILRVLGR